MAKRSLTREQEQEILSRVRSWEEGTDVFPNGYAYATRGRKRKAGSPAPSPRRLVASRSSEEGRRTAAYIAGDDVSFEDIISYAKYTPEFSQEFSNSKKKFEDIQSPGDFIWWVFNKSGSYKEERDSFQCPEACHIMNMAYCERWNLLKVTFTNENTEIVYTRVPANVFEILHSHAERGERGIGVDGQYHTKVGMAFWDYVRIRGTRHGVQYPAYYLSGAPSANKGVGGKAAAAAFGPVLRIGKDGKAIDTAEIKAAREAAPDKALAFLRGEISASDIEDIRKCRSAKYTQDEEGTVAYALTHGDIDKARELGEKLMKFIRESPVLSSSRRNELLEFTRNPSLSEPYMPLLEMENRLNADALWPPSN